MYLWSPWGLSVAPEGAASSAEIERPQGAIERMVLSSASADWPEGWCMGTGITTFPPGEKENKSWRHSRILSSDVNHEVILNAINEPKENPLNQILDWSMYLHMDKSPLRESQSASLCPGSGQGPCRQPSGCGSRCGLSNWPFPSTQTQSAPDKYSRGSLYFIVLVCFPPF